MYIITRQRRKKKPGERNEATMFPPETQQDSAAVTRTSRVGTLGMFGEDVSPPQPHVSSLELKDLMLF